MAIKAKTKQKVRIRDREGTRRAIIKAAMRVSIANGAERTTITEIAQAAGVPTSLAHYHFPSFEELLAEVFVQVVTHIRRIVTPPVIEPDTRVVDALLGYLESHWRWALDYPRENSLWLYFYYVASVQARFRKLNDEIRESGRARTAMLLYRGIETGEFRLPKERDVPSVAEEIQSITTGAWILIGTETKASWKPLIASSLENVRRLIGVT